MEMRGLRHYYQLSALFCAVATLWVPIASATYCLRDLGTLPGGYRSSATAINSAGVVAGVSFSHGSTSDVATAYRWAGSMFSLGTLGGTDSIAYGINASGQIVGGSDLLPPSPSTDAFFYSAGVMTDMGTFGGTETGAWGINKLGHATGSSVTTSGYPNAFLYVGGVLQNLGTLPGGSESFGAAINDADQLSNFNGQIKSKDDVSVQYQLVAAGQITPVLQDTLQGKAKVNGEDILTPLLTQAATAVLTQVSQPQPQAQAQAPAQPQAQKK